MTPRQGALATAYTDSLATASPQKLLVMLYDRLVLDLDRAEEKLLAGRSAHAELVHAQDIVMELLSSLDTTVWDGAAGLASIYTYLHTQLVSANVRSDAALVAECRGHVVPLRDAWRQALASLTGAAATASTYAAGATARLAESGPTGVPGRAGATADVRRAPLSVTA